MKSAEKLLRGFALTSGLLLLAFALVRFVVAAGGSQVLTLPDPIFGMAIRFVAFGMGGIAFLVGLLCLFGRLGRIQFFMVVWLMTNWVVYRAALWLMEYNVRCSSIGFLTDPLRGARAVAPWILWGVPLYLLVGGYTTFLMAWWQERKAQRRAVLKTACPNCGGHIAFPAQGIGLLIDCPHCRLALTLQEVTHKL